MGLHTITSHLRADDRETPDSQTKYTITTYTQLQAAQEMVEEAQRRIAQCKANLDTKSNILTAFLKRLEGIVEASNESTRDINDSKDGAAVIHTEAVDSYAQLSVDMNEERTTQALLAIQALVFALTSEIQLTDTIIENSIIEILDCSEENPQPEYFIYSNSIPSYTLIEFNGKRIKVLTPKSPIGKAIHNKTTGDSVEYTVKGQTQRFQILDVL